jgi:thiaminase/transcriptional activator TenA
MPFGSDQIDRLQPLWRAMLEHPFLLQTRDGTLADETFARWMRQDYLYVGGYMRFLAAMLARAPECHRESLLEALNGLRRELSLFEQRAGEAGVDLSSVRPTFVNHAYIQFLIATAFGGSYAEAFTVLYVAERAYHDSWRVVKDGISPQSKWYPFVENWAGDEFGRYVAYLESELDALAADVGQAERELMAEAFELTTRYEIAFWEMALADESWPGLRRQA